MLSLFISVTFTNLVHLSVWLCSRPDIMRVWDPNADPLPVQAPSAKASLIARLCRSKPTTEVATHLQTQPLSTEKGRWITYITPLPLTYLAWVIFLVIAAANAYVIVELMIGAQ